VLIHLHSLLPDMVHLTHLSLCDMCDVYELYVCVCVCVCVVCEAHVTDSWHWGSPVLLLWLIATLCMLLICDVYTWLKAETEWMLITVYCVLYPYRASHAVNSFSHG